MAMECTTATILRVIKGMGWELAPCPCIRWLDKTGNHIIVTQQSKYGFSSFELKYDPGERDFTYFRALDPSSREN